MSPLWEIRVPFNFDGELSPEARREIERAVQRWLEGAKSPLPADAEIACVEVVEDCPCCEMPESWCHCLFEMRTPEAGKCKVCFEEEGVLGYPSHNTCCGACEGFCDCEDVHNVRWCLDHDRWVSDDREVPA